MATDDRVCKLDMKHGFVKQIIRNQVSRDEYDKEVKIASSIKKPKKPKQVSSRQSQAYYLPPRLRKKSNEDSVDVENKKEESKTEVLTIEEQNSTEEKEFVKDKLFKLEYTDQHGEINSMVIYVGDSAEDVARDLAVKTNLPDDLYENFKNRILEHMTEYLERL